jgi:hypothetical protein
MVKLEIGKCYSTNNNKGNRYLGGYYGYYANQYLFTFDTFNQDPSNYLVQVNCDYSKHVPVPMNNNKKPIGGTRRRRKLRNRTRKH